MQSIRPFATILVLALGACAPSPWFTGDASRGTPGEVPRDDRGEPMWAEIPPPPPPPEAAPSILVNPGPPIQKIPGR